MNCKNLFCHNVKMPAGLPLPYLYNRNKSLVGVFFLRKNCKDILHFVGGCSKLFSW